MAVGMFGATTATSLVGLSTGRVVTGLGIGGMLAAINAVAAEFSNAKRRHLSVVTDVDRLLRSARSWADMVAAQLLRTKRRRSVFYFGAAVTFALIPIVLFTAPESVHWLARRSRPDALDRINAGAAPAWATRPPRPCPRWSRPAARHRRPRSSRPAS